MISKIRTLYRSTYLDNQMNQVTLIFLWFLRDVHLLLQKRHQLTTDVHNELTTPINPGSVSVCLTVTWITGLGRLRASIVMATLSGTVLLFLLDRETRERGEIKWCKEKREMERWGVYESPYINKHFTTPNFWGNHPTSIPILICY